MTPSDRLDSMWGSFTSSEQRKCDFCWSLLVTGGCLHGECAGWKTVIAEVARGEKETDEFAKIYLSAYE